MNLHYLHNPISIGNSTNICKFEYDQYEYTNLSKKKFKTNNYIGRHLLHSSSLADFI